MKAPNKYLNRSYFVDIKSDDILKSLFYSFIDDALQKLEWELSSITRPINSLDQKNNLKDH